MTQERSKVRFKVLDTRLNGGGAHRIDGVDAVDHQLPGAVVVEAGPSRVVQGFSLGILGQGVVLHAWDQAVQFFAQEFHQPRLDVTGQAHRGVVRRHSGNVTGGIGLGDHALANPRTVFE